MNELVLFCLVSGGIILGVLILVLIIERRERK